MKENQKNVPTAAAATLSPAAILLAAVTLSPAAILPAAATLSPAAILPAAATLSSVTMLPAAATLSSAAAVANLSLKKAVVANLWPGIEVAVANLLVSIETVQSYLKNGGWSLMKKVIANIYKFIN